MSHKVAEPDLPSLFDRLALSKFRSSFSLHQRDLAYIQKKQLTTVLAHARQFATERLGDAHPANDGKQTPMSGHPVFVAQHATATCCRGCLRKWHEIEKGKTLSPAQIDYIVEVIQVWLQAQIDHAQASTPLGDCKDTAVIEDRAIEKQRRLFDDLD